MMTVKNMIEMIQCITTLRGRGGGVNQCEFETIHSHDYKVKAMKMPTHCGSCRYRSARRVLCGIG